VNNTKLEPGTTAPALNSGDIDLELGEGQHSHNTAAVKNKQNKELMQSTDISVKKKCCVIL
jgi:hypothetical protein